MSYFRSKGIVLKKTKYGEKEFLYSIFSYDFGRIDVIKKKAAKEKPLDIGYDVNFEIHSNKNFKISRIANIKINREFDPSNEDFETINEYLSLIFQVYSRTEKNIAVFEIYTLLNELLKVKISKEKIILAKLKLKNIFGELQIENKDIMIQKILKFIDANSSKNCLRLSGLETSQLSTLQKMCN